MPQQMLNFKFEILRDPLFLYVLTVDASVAAQGNTPDQCFSILGLSEMSFGDRGRQKCVMSNGVTDI